MVLPPLAGDAAVTSGRLVSVVWSWFSFATISLSTWAICWCCCWSSASCSSSCSPDGDSLQYSLSFVVLWLTTQPAVRTAIIIIANVAIYNAIATDDASVSVFILDIRRLNFSMIADTTKVDILLQPVYSIKLMLAALRSVWCHFPDVVGTKLGKSFVSRVVSWGGSDLFHMPLAGNLIRYRTVHTKVVYIAYTLHLSFIWLRIATEKSGQNDSSWKVKNVDTLWLLERK